MESLKEYIRKKAIENDLYHLHVIAGDTHLEFAQFGANWQKEQDNAIIQEFEKMKREFYVNICRAYNAGKQNMGETINDEKKFISSHAYFVNEFPEFKNYIP